MWADGVSGGSLGRVKVYRLVRLEQGRNRLDSPRAFRSKCHDHLLMIPDTPASGSLCVGQNRGWKFAGLLVQLALDHAKVTELRHSLRATPVTADQVVSTLSRL